MKRIFRFAFLTILLSSPLLSTHLLAADTNQAKGYLERPEYQALVKKVEGKGKLTRERLDQLFAGAKDFDGFGRYLPIALPGKRCC